MKKLFSLVACALALGSCVHSAGWRGGEVREGDRLPHFTVVLNDGTTVTEKDYSQGRALIAFFNTGCPDCVEDLDVLQEFHLLHSDEVRMLLVSREESRESVDAYWFVYGYTMRYSAQEDRKVYSLFTRGGIPKIYTVDDGVVTGVLEAENYVTTQLLELAFCL